LTARRCEEEVTAQGVLEGISLVIASEAKQSTLPLVEPWIASSLRSSQ
jgi:hypothetical protein